jgi:hypothetical protein
MSKCVVKPALMIHRTANEELLKFKIHKLYVLHDEQLSIVRPCRLIPLPMDWIGLEKFKKKFDLLGI